MSEDTLEFFRKFKDAKKTFFKSFRQAKKDVILQDEDDFLDDMVEYMQATHGISEEDAEEYADRIYEIWEDCSCSMTAFDREMNDIKKQLENG